MQKSTAGCIFYAAVYWMVDEFQWTAHFINPSQ